MSTTNKILWVLVFVAASCAGYVVVYRIIRQPEPPPMVDVPRYGHTIETHDGSRCYLINQTTVCPGTVKWQDVPGDTRCKDMDDVRICSFEADDTKQAPLPRRWTPGDIEPLPQPKLSH